MTLNEALQEIAMMRNTPGSGGGEWVVDIDGDWTRPGVVLGEVLPCYTQPLTWRYRISYGALVVATCSGYTSPRLAMQEAEKVIEATLTAREKARRLR